jgi:hypothetical protein
MSCGTAGQKHCREDPGHDMIAAIQTPGELLHWHPPFHVRITCGEFAELPQFDRECQHVAWQEAVFGLYLADEKIEPEVVENMRCWPHSGFRVDQSVFLPSGGHRTSDPV